MKETQQAQLSASGCSLDATATGKVLLHEVIPKHLAVLLETRTNGGGEGGDTLMGTHQGVLERSFEHDDLARHILAG